MPRIVSPRVACGAAVLVLLILLSGGTRREPAAEASGPSWIDVTSDAVQTVYQGGVPHTDSAGNPRLTYDPTASFFPIGIYSPQPCKVTQELSWPSFEGDPAWDGTYTLIVNLGSVRETGIPDLAVFWENQGPALSGIAERLPATMELYYSVWPTGVFRTVAEGSFTSGPCPPDSPDASNVLETIGRAGFNLALVQNPWVLLPLREGGPHASQVKLVLTGIGAFGAFREDLFQEFKGEGESGHPDVYGWYIADEPDFCFGAVCEQRLDHVRTIYEEHKGQTSQVFFLTAGPGFTTNNWLWWPEFIQVGDTSCHDNYPKFTHSLLPTVRQIADTVSAQTVTVGESKPSWVVLQAMAQYQFPTPAEMRAMAYAAIVHGATGIWQFMWDSFIARDGGVVGIRPDPHPSYAEAVSPDATVATTQQIADSTALWNSLDSSQGGLNAELEALKPVILSPTVTTSDPYWAYSAFVDQKHNHWSPIRTIFKSAGGEQYLIAVNIDSFRVNARFKFVQGIGGVDVMFEGNRRLIPYSGAFTDYFAPFAVHVYRFTFACYEPRAAPDYVVNLLDLYRVINALGGRAQGPAGPYDVNYDGVVSLADVMLVARNVGTRCPH